MTAGCSAPISDGTLIDYWTGDLRDGQEQERVEEHLFTCAACSARLAWFVSLKAGLATLVRQGRVAGIVSRALLNRMQREGVHIRMYSVVPGETVPCAVFAGDDLVVTVLRADFAGVDAVSVSVTSTADVMTGEIDDVPVHGPHAELLWATPAAFVRQLPSTRLQFTLAARSTGAELGTYVLEHSAIS